MKPTKTPMTPERFAYLAESYGGSIARWPQADRAAAETLLQTAPELKMMLARARDLDDVLFTSLVPSPSAELARRILSQAPQARSGPSPALWRWLSGLVAVGVLASGAAAGAAVVALSPGQSDGLNGIYDHTGLGEVAVMDRSQAPSSQAARV